MAGSVEVTVVYQAHIHVDRRDSIEESNAKEIWRMNHATKNVVVVTSVHEVERKEG